MDEACAVPGTGAKRVADVANMAKQHITTEQACSSLFIPSMGSMLGHACIAAVLCIEGCDDVD